MNTIEILQPMPYDLVDNNILIAGNAAAFEGSLSVYVGDGHYEFRTTAQVGSMALKQFQTQIKIPKDIEFKLDKLLLTVADDSALEPGDPNIPKVHVPILFGPRIMPNYYGYWDYEVKRGDTLSSIASSVYDDPSMWEIIYRANIDKINDPNLIYTGQVFKIPRTA